MNKQWRAVIYRGSKRIWRSRLVLLLLFLLTISFLGKIAQANDVFTIGDRYDGAFGDNPLLAPADSTQEINSSQSPTRRGAGGGTNLGDGLYLPASDIDPNNILLKVVIDSDQLSKLNTSNTSSIANALLPISRLIYEKFKDDFDFLFFVLDKKRAETADITHLYGVNFAVSNAIDGIGRGIFNSAAAWGSFGKLKSAMFITYDQGIASGPTLHEFCHNWGAYILTRYDMNGIDIDNNPSHPEYAHHWGV
ncbi:MAG: hypothetical protein LBG29_04840, partial [Synergistaceae bacterium]|nr:hypothetical protein [Synergistaceae bacterium]